MVSLSRMQAYGLVSTTIFVSTVINAFRQRSNFYAAAVYLSKSNACMMILWNQAIYQIVLFGKVLQVIFLGELRLIEVERLQERGWFAVTETLLALTIFKDEFESTFVLLFVSLLFLKVFHWLASDRIEAMEQTQSVTRLAHARMIGLLSLLWVADVVMLLFAADCILVEGPTVMIMFASEYMILVASAWATTMKYVITCIDMRREVQWEEKSVYVFYVDLIADFFKLVTYLTFFGLTLTFYGLPLNILRDVYLTLRSFLLRIRDLRRYRLATRNMDTLYPNATREEMDQMNDKTCIICREDMEFQPGAGDASTATTPAAAPTQDGGEAPAPAPVAPVAPSRTPQRGPNETPKKLPCGHVFHFHCLKSWLERQQSCPTCRRPVLPQEQPTNTRPGAARAGNRDGGAGRGNEGGPRDPNDQAQALRQAQINLARNLGREAFGVIFPNVPFPDEADQPRDAPGNPPATTSAPTLAPPQPPAHEQTPNVPLPPASPSATSSSRPQSSASNPPVASTSTPPSPPGPSRSHMPSLLVPPTSTPSPSGSDSLNPLARFSLPDLEVPTTGEAGLYHAPPAFGNIDLSSLSPSTSQNGYADIAYGAFPQASGRTSNVPPPPGYGTVRRGARSATLEERIKQIRERMVETAAGSTDAGRSETRTGLGGDRQDKGKGKEKETETTTEGTQKEDQAASQVEDVPALATSHREAALIAAERRRNAQACRPPSPSSWIRKTDSLAPWSDAAQSTPLPPSREPSPTPPTWPRGPTVPSSRRATPPTTPSLASSTVSIPRLIPLFDPSNPSAGSIYPALTSKSLSTPTVTPGSIPSASSSTDQANEVDQLVRRGIEEKLRMMVGFQDRLEGLVDEMRSALSSTNENPNREGVIERDEVDVGMRNDEGGEMEKVTFDDERDM
ncbi:hypothetical protein JCM16303_001758 [Sporobolomyces ruberrimus]